MKYNTISTSSLSTEGKKSTLTIYADTDFAREKMASSEEEVALIRGELALVQRALKLQTRRCRQLVAEYTKRLQLKEQQYEAERRLRNDQLSRVLKALLIFEARLRQEQKFISHQLEEKDYIIKKQQNDIQKLLSNHCCKSCNQYYNPSSRLGSLDSSSEYVVTDYHDYQSSNFESLDSSSETYASISKYSDPGKSPFQDSNQSVSSEENIKTDSNQLKCPFTKNKNKDSLCRKPKKIGHRKSNSNYFEVLKMRTDNHSPSSNEESNYENLDSLTSESLKTEIGSVSERIERIFQENRNKLEGTTSIDQSSTGDTSDNNETASSVTAYNSTIIMNQNGENSDLSSNSDSSKNTFISKDQEGNKISNTIPVFEGDGETNDNWYASASDQEDEQQRDVYRNNPVLECMNQILMQNINDPMTSPPKTPSMEKKSGKNNKKVKFSEDDQTENELDSNYYETPVQKTPNFYETPQSIYSNDYEQILSNCNEAFHKNYKDINCKFENMLEKEINTSVKKLSLSPIKGSEVIDINMRHYYVDMDTKSEEDATENKIIRKSKILRTPPALPPKPANLMSKYKINNISQSLSKDKLSERSLDSEPDYCSISEINLPTTDRSGSFTKMNVVAEINTPSSETVLAKSIVSTDRNIVFQSSQIEKDLPSPSHYKPVSLSEPIPNLAIRKSVEKLNIQIAKQVSTKDTSTPLKSPSPEIPKLPQVTEIIIPDEVESKSEENISHDNYVKNNTQILQQKNYSDRTRPIQIGSSVSSLIASFNNKQIISEIKKKPDTRTMNKRLFSSFENLQSLKPHLSSDEINEDSDKSFEKFDLSQNFEEFKLDDCDIEDFGGNYSDGDSTNSNQNVKQSEIVKRTDCKMLPRAYNFSSSTHVELVRATNDVIAPQLNVNSLQQLKKKLELEKNRAYINNQIKQDSISTSRCNEPTYEHFLECTGLSSKSILTPSRMLSNHKSMLKPKDVKLRSKVKSNNVIERQGNTVKYWSEPYL